MNGRVLIVEDEALVALTLEDALSAAGYECRVADRAAPAIAHAASLAFDVAVVDVRLAGGDDGIALASILAAMQPCLLILFATGNPALVRAQARVGRACLAKPFDVEWLLLAVEALRLGRILDVPGCFELELI